MDERMIARFWSKVDRRGPDDCWLWLAYIDKVGYGRFGIGGGPERAHRVALWVATGERPLGFVCHRCDVRACVNHRHLYLGNANTNHADMLSRGRRVNHVGQSHGRAKITNTEAAEILSLKGIRSQVQLAVEFGVAQTTISRIHRGSGWRNVQSGHASVSC
jgi:hypothetical protein